MARLREAIGGAVLPARMASRTAAFQSVTTSPLAGVPILDARFIAPMQTMKIKPLKKAFMRTLLSANSGPVYALSGFCVKLVQSYSCRHRPVIHSVPQVNVYNR